MSAAIEAPLTLLQIPVKALLADSVKPAQMPLRLVPEVFDALDVVAAFRDERFTVIHTSVTKLGDLKGVIGREAVSVSEAIGPNPLTDEGHERLGFGIGNDGGHYMTAPF